MWWDQKWLGRLLSKILRLPGDDATWALVDESDTYVIGRAWCGKLSESAWERRYRSCWVVLGLEWIGSRGEKVYWALWVQDRNHRYAVRDHRHGRWSQWETFWGCNPLTRVRNRGGFLYESAPDLRYRLRRLIWFLPTRSILRKPAYCNTKNKTHLTAIESCSRQRYSTQLNVDEISFRGLFR